MIPTEALDTLDQLGHHHVRRYRELYAIEPGLWGPHLVAIAARASSPPDDFETLEAARLAFEASPHPSRNPCGCS